jgi:hypothetical protein
MASGIVPALVTYLTAAEEPHHLDAGAPREAQVR